MAKVETVKVISKEAKGGYVVINKSDFSTRRFKLFDPEPPRVRKKVEKVEPEKVKKVTSKIKGNKTNE